MLEGRGRPYKPADQSPGSRDREVFSVSVRERVRTRVSAPSARSSRNLPKAGATAAFPRRAAAGVVTEDVTALDEHQERRRRRRTAASADGAEVGRGQDRKPERDCRARASLRQAEQRAPRRRRACSASEPRRSASGRRGTTRRPGSAEQQSAHPTPRCCSRPRAIVRARCEGRSDSTARHHATPAERAIGLRGTQSPRMCHPGRSLCLSHWLSSRDR
jgi:hypothetical protein